VHTKCKQTRANRGNLSRRRGIQVGLTLSSKQIMPLIVQLGTQYLTSIFLDDLRLSSYVELIKRTYPPSPTQRTPSVIQIGDIDQLQSW
jgi:hypothetical protein